MDSLSSRAAGERVTGVGGLQEPCDGRRRNSTWPACADPVSSVAFPAASTPTAGPVSANPCASICTVQFCAAAVLDGADEDAGAAEEEMPMDEAGAEEDGITAEEDDKPLVAAVLLEDEDATACMGWHSPAWQVSVRLQSLSEVHELSTGSGRVHAARAVMLKMAANVMDLRMGHSWQRGWVRTAAQTSQMSLVVSTTAPPSTRRDRQRGARISAGFTVRST
jgi:hypothetical protein